MLLFSRGVIFTRARVSLALPSLKKNGGLLVVYCVKIPSSFGFFSTTRTDYGKYSPRSTQRTMVGTRSRHHRNITSSPPILLVRFSNFPVVDWLLTLVQRVTQSHCGQMSL